MWRESFPVAGAFDDDLVAGVGQAIQRAVAQDGVIEETQPFVHGPVAGDDEAGRPMPIEDEFVEVGGLLGGQAMETQVIGMSRSGVRKDRKVRSTELSTLAWVRALKKSSAWLKRTEYPARTAA